MAIDYLGFDERCESPIERRFVGGLAVLELRRNLNIRLLPDADRAAEIEAIRQGYFPGFWFHVFPQEQIGPYRVDFLVIASNGLDRCGVVVECDGREFHQDSLKDFQRDADLERLGYSVVRLTGRDIWKDQVECAERVLLAAASRLETTVGNSGRGEVAPFRPFADTLRGSLDIAFWNYLGQQGEAEE